MGKFIVKKNRNNDLICCPLKCSILIGKYIECEHKGFVEKIFHAMCWLFLI